MPYIAQEDRPRFTPHSESVPVTAGQLTFQLQQLVQQFLIYASVEYDVAPISYALLAEVLGAIEGLKADFIDRILLPYEACKAAENGDVWDSRLIATNRPLDASASGV